MLKDYKIVKGFEGRKISTPQGYFTLDPAVLTDEQAALIYNDGKSSMIVRAKAKSAKPKEKN